MKRSQINKIQKDAVEFLKKQKFYLPPFAFWRPLDWKNKGQECREIVDNMLGWDLTDFGKGDYYELGILLFTIRNGNLKNKKYKKPYAEKILLSDSKEMAPMHFHWKKMEDIINRGKNKLLIQIYNSTKDGGLAKTDVSFSVDGMAKKITAGSIVKLSAGESITLVPGIYHKFWPENGILFLGEVSTVNDDVCDNRFYEKMGRFPTIEEDEETLYPLCFEYAKYCKFL
ncbi:MAG: D-lyxose/D-mannose family sugar isomerase [Candidatus Firestonebacteria bacterium]